MCRPTDNGVKCVSGPAHGVQDKRDADGPDLNVKAQAKKDEVKSDSEDEDEENARPRGGEGGCAPRLLAVELLMELRALTHRNQPHARGTALTGTRPCWSLEGHCWL